MSKSSPSKCIVCRWWDRFEYLWQDSESFKRPTKMPAPEYIEHLMAWVQSNIDNESMFPSRIGAFDQSLGSKWCWFGIPGVPFPKTFPALIRQIVKRLYRIYAHIYCHHYPVVVQLGLEPHLNTSFKHYVLFIDEHSLASGKDFWGPLGDLVDSMLRSDWLLSRYLELRRSKMWNERTHDRISVHSIAAGQVWARPLWYCLWFSIDIN